MLAKAIANVSEVCFFNVSSSTLTSKWRGESEKLVSTLFNMARYYAPSIVFFDEIDALMTSRGGHSEHEASRAFKATFLAQIDGLIHSHPSGSSTHNGNSDEPSNPLVMLLATSNCPWDLDPALRRRLEKRVLIPLPDKEARLQLLKLHLRDVVLDPTSVNLEELARSTEGYSGSDLKILCRDAALSTFRTMINGKTSAEILALKTKQQQLINHALTQIDFEQAKKQVKPSVDSKMVQKCEEWQREFGSGM